MADVTYWRPGSKVHRTLYRGDELVGLVDTPALAMEIVTAVNARGRSLVEVAADSIEAFAGRLGNDHDELLVAKGMREAISIMRRVAERESGRERSLAAADCPECNRRIWLDDGRLIPHPPDDDPQSSLCPASLRTPDAQRRSEATPQKDLQAITYTEFDRIQDQLSRVDPYDTTKGFQDPQ